MPARATTAKRFTAQPCAASKRPKAATQEAMNGGWGVWAICWTIPVSVPAGAEGRAWPCQKPRPGQAWRRAMPTKNRPMTRRTTLPSRGLDHALSGRATRAPAKQ